MKVENRTRKGGSPLIVPPLPHIPTHEDDPPSLAGPQSPTTTPARHAFPRLHIHAPTSLCRWHHQHEPSQHSPLPFPCPLGPTQTHTHTHHTPRPTPRSPHAPSRPPWNRTRTALSRYLFKSRTVSFLVACKREGESEGGRGGGGKEGGQ